MKTYSEKLKDPRWQKKRLEIMQRDNWTCQICGDKKRTLAVHHKEYIDGHDPWNYDESNLLTLCDFCHAVVSKYPNSDLINKISGLTFYDEPFTIKFIVYPGKSTLISIGQGNSNYAVFITPDQQKKVIKLLNKK